MILHTYFTNGMFGWGKLLIESFNYYNDPIPIIATTRDLTNKQIRSLRALGSNVTVLNKEINYANVAKRAGVSKDQLLKFKHSVETRGVNSANKVWKQFISVEDRYRDSINSIVSQFPDGECITHIDVDMYFRGNVRPLFDIIENNDISIRFRVKDNKKRTRDAREVLGNIVGIKISPKSREFLDIWRKYINKIPLNKKPKGYGQTSFFYAYLEACKIGGFSWGNIPPIYTSSSKDKRCPIWVGNKGKKNTTLSRFKKDFVSTTNKNSIEVKDGNENKIK